ncbi:hypothetical protein ABFS82_02G058900 [Erythranthe guttata]|uniref:metacaspase-3-like n=1 Tax=Erythranthe guttata TaxID=4155 RepID=UPI00064D812F|nr:PREDICTED: metacaspase-3-like [Erythranthe guttata]|eukprot:XP_012828323.1 PREDICTED: metacaspase-3-like [Erythranthe guttata]
MASRRLNCRWCGVPSLVPVDSQNLYCQACRRFTVFQGYYSGYPPSGSSGNANFMSSDTYVTNPGYTAYGRTYQPVNSGGVYRVQPQLYAPAAHGCKRAVLCGITYKGHKHSLNGSINDVLYMKKLLADRFGFPHSSILVLTEEEDSSRVPTKRNIRAALRWLVQGCQPGDSLVFHYSGHGSQVRDRDGDEIDGYDESLLPVDYETEGRILDDEINATIVRPLPKGATLHSIIDTCFSGTFLDLPNVCRINRDGYYKWEDHRTAAAYRGTSGGYAISISACDDHQNSGDTTAFTGAATGALTYSFVQTLEQESRLTYGHLLMVMHKRISAAREKVGLNSNAPHLSQEPQLSSSHKFDIHSKPFTL